MEKRNLDDLTPRQIVEELDKYVVGQVQPNVPSPWPFGQNSQTKLPDEIAQDVLPKNILMIGSPSRKTEIARRLARTPNSPFIRSRHRSYRSWLRGARVESMIRELTEIAVDMSKQSAYVDVLPTAEENSAEKLLDFFCRQRRYIIRRSLRSRIR